MDISKLRMNPRVAKRRLMCLWTLKFPPQLLPLKAYRRGELLFECLFVSALTLEHSTIWWKFLGMDPAQSIGIGTRFLPTENVDTSSKIDGEVLRNMHPSCSVWRQSPFWKSSLRQNIPSVLKCWYGINWQRSFKFITFSPSFSPMIGPRNGPLLQQVTQFHCMFVTQVWRLWKFSLNWIFKGRDFAAFYKLQYFMIFCDNVLRSTKCFNLLAKESFFISLNFSNFLWIFPLELHVDITWWRWCPFRLHCQLFNHWIHQSFVLICLPRCTSKILLVTDALQKSFSVALKSRFERPSFFYRFQDISL